MKSRILGCGALAGCLGWCAAARSQGVQFVPIPPAVAGQNIAVLGLSDDGLTVVGLTGPAGQLQNAFRWTEAAGLEMLWSGFAYDASADGSVVVGGTGRLGDVSGEAVRWTPSGGALLLGPREARAVSADGSVVVGGTTPGTSSSTLGKAFRWTEAGGVQFLPPLTPTSGLYAYDLSADGSVVVGYGNPSAPYSQGFRWTTLGTVSLGPMPGGPTGETIATACSADGSVIAGFGDGAQLGEPFRWTSIALTGLGVLPNMAFSIPNDASADGSVFVGSVYDLQSGFHAMIWDAKGGLRLLQQDLENRYGFTLPGWTLNIASGISADGSRIAGYGTDVLGRRHGFLITLGASCYPDCDGDGALHLADFGCFQTRFATGDPYADCNGDGALDLADFGCFQTGFAVGCP